MLVPAIIHKNQIAAEMQKLYYTDNMLYLTGSRRNWNPDIQEEPDEGAYQFAIIDKNKLIGYLCYYIDWYGSCANRFGLVSFDKGNSTIGVDVYKTIRHLIDDYKLHRIEFRMVGGNPVENHYDNICNHFGGTKHILRDAIKDYQGNYHDDIIYEIILEVHNDN